MASRSGRTDLYLRDTNILSQLARPKPDVRVTTWASRLSRIALSVITVEEIRFGLSWKPNARIQQWFLGFLTGHCHVIPITTEVAFQAGLLRGQLRARGEVRTQADMLLAAPASVHGLTLVTRNTRDFEGCAIALLNPFD